MFKIDPDPTFTTDVKLTVPGQKKPETIKATFKYKTKDAVADFSKSLVTAEKTPCDESENCIAFKSSGSEPCTSCEKATVINKDSLVSIEDACVEVFAGWGNVDEAFSEEALRRLIKNYVTAGSEILTQYFKELGESRAKN